MKENLIKLLCCLLNHDDLRSVNLIKNQDGNIVDG